MGIRSFFSRSSESKRMLASQRAGLYRMAYAWSHDAALADDLVQETFAKALQKADQLRNPDAGNAWLFAILANCFRDHCRRHRATESIDRLDLVHSETPELKSSHQEIARRVQNAIAQLSEGQRQVVALVDLEGFSYVETAKILAVPIGTVMSRLCRARNALRDQLPGLAANATSGVAPRLRRVK